MKGLPRSLGRAAQSLAGKARAPFAKHRININNVTVNVADGAPGFGTAVIGDLPEGNILLLGAVGYINVRTSDADVIATFDGDVSVGTTPTADNALSGTDVDILPSTALGAATAKVSPTVRAVSTDAMGGGILDNTDGAMEVNLNLLIDDASISGAAAFLANGYVEIAYSRMGDD